MSTREVQAAVFKALAHPTRLAIVEILASEGPRCVCELVCRFGCDQSTISKHLAVLRSVGIVSCTKEGLNVTYQLSMKCVYQFMKCIERLESEDDAQGVCGPVCATGGTDLPGDEE